jgi:hypothetical protein
MLSVHKPSAISSARILLSEIGRSGERGEARGAPKATASVVACCAPLRGVSSAPGLTTSSPGLGQGGCAHVPLDVCEIVIDGPAFLLLIVEFVNLHIISPLASELLVAECIVM